MAIDAGTLVVSVIPNTAGFTAKLTSLMTKVGTSLNAAGISSSTAAIGVAVGVVATMATKAALEFEQAFTKIDAVSNASAANIEQWRSDVLALSGETAQSPTELADALYFLASAGLETNQVMDVLANSAKASAIGLGETTDIAKISAQALNAYADSGLTAANVTDVLVQAVKSGTAEPEEFAVALGRVLPIASRAGVGFDEVAASLASLSNIGLNVNEGTTALRGLLQALVAPSGQAAESLAQVGISTDQMRESISEGGLLGALTLLEKRTGGNIDVLRKIIPNIRALTGEMGLTGENAEKVQQVFDEVINSSGAMAEAFKITTEGPMFQFQQVAANAQRALIGLGEALLPIATLLADVIGGAFGALANILSENIGLVQALVVAFLGFTAIKFLPGLFAAIASSLTAMAAAGLSKIATGMFALAQALLNIGATNAAFRIAAIAQALPALASAIVPIVAAVGGLVYWYNVLSSSSDKLKADTAEFAAALLQPGASLDSLRKSLGLTDSQFQDFLVDVRTGSADLSAEALAIEDYAQATDKAIAGILNVGTQSSEAIIKVSALTGQVTTTIKENASAYDVYSDALVYSTKLTNAQRITIANQIQDFYALGGQLNQTKELWLTNAISMGKNDTVMGFLNTRIEELNDNWENLGEGAAGAGSGFAKLFQEGQSLAEGIGTTFIDLQSAVSAAIIKDGGVMGETFDKLVGDITKKVAELRQGIFDAVNFTGQALSGLSEQALKSPEAILKSFKEAAAQTKSFGRDLLEITREGGAAGKALATNLLASGDAGVAAAATIAGAGDKMRDHLINAFGSGETAADKVANKLTGKMATALNQIRNLLVKIARHWVIEVDAETAAAKAAIQGIYDLYGGKTLFIKVAAAGGIGGHGGGVSPEDYAEFGAYIPGAASGGFVDRPTILNVGERHRREMVLPLENSAGEKALAKAMGAAARSLDGGRVRGGDGGSISGRLVLDGPVTLRVGKTSMDAYISGVARSEDDKQKRYDERIGRMRRD